MAREPWFFGLLREAGSYRVVAAGPTEGRVRRALDAYTNPTMVVTLDDLPALGVSEREWRRWLPEAQGSGAAEAGGGASGEERRESGRA